MSKYYQDYHLTREEKEIFFNINPNEADYINAHLFSSNHK